MICYLEIRTFKGAAPGASHYFGSLYCREEKSKDLTYTLSILQARALNKTQGYAEDSDREEDRWCWEPGKASNTFLNEKHILDYAKKVWRKEAEGFPNATILIRGDHCICDPQEPIAWAKTAEAEKLAEQLLAIWQEYEAIPEARVPGRYYYEKDRKLADPLLDKWDKLLSKSQE